MKTIIDAHDYLELSSYINYQLSGTPVNWRTILSLVVNKLRPDADLLLESLAYLGNAYDQKRRKLGPLMMLHPIRVAAILARAEDEPTTLDILTALFHDLREDFESYGTSADDRKLANRYAAILNAVDGKTQWLLQERIHFLTRPHSQTYRRYLDLLIERASMTPELILIKLIDRLDNTLDLRLDIINEVSSTDFYEVIFEALFTKSYKGVSLANPHQIASRINGAMRLYQLYKNMVLLTLVRRRNVHLSDGADRVFISLAMAGINEAKNIVLHLLAYHIAPPAEHARILFDTLSHLKEEGSYAKSVRKLILERFDPEEECRLKKRLDELYADKRLMCETTLMFLVVFSNFINDGKFSIENI